jgi:phosphoribosylaminoimidazolecarboxamide formyltransferase / IMP cyclohydrolase
VRALLSVSDKSGLVDFASQLAKLGYELVSTGGTFQALTEAGLNVIQVAEVTGSPEMLDGRVKTLHPLIHGGLLARRDLPEHVAQLEQHGIEPIDILVSNLYPFEATVTTPGLEDIDIIEQIDIGGPAMVRAAAKNFASVVVITSPSDYDDVLSDFRSGEVPLTRRRALAAKAFGHVSTYDSLVAGFLRGDNAASQFPDELSIGLRLARTPKYGENSHQRAAAYRRLSAGAPEVGILNAERLAGDELSFNNYLDTDAAWQASQLFDEPAACIVKHMVPCGLAVRPTLADAYAAAFDGDPVSAFGGIVALNRIVDLETAQQLRKIKLDIIIAPGYDPDAQEIVLKKKNTRVLVLQNRESERSEELDVRPIGGGMLLQQPDIHADDTANWRVVTRKQPTDRQMEDCAFAWRAIPLVKSNAIVFARDKAIVGLGAGQPNRLESVAIAARKAGDAATGAVLASDAFFPFADGIQAGIDAGVTAVIQPGGSMRDDEVIAAADDAGIAMVFTGRRHFRH